jgi:hypothetical protein
MSQYIYSKYSIYMLSPIVQTGTSWTLEVDSSTKQGRKDLPANDGVDHDGFHLVRRYAAVPNTRPRRSMDLRTFRKEERVMFWMVTYDNIPGKLVSCRIISGHSDDGEEARLTSHVAVVYDERLLLVAKGAFRSLLET